MATAIDRFTRQLAADGRSGHTRAAYRRDLAALARFLGGNPDPALADDANLAMDAGWAPNPFRGVPERAAVPGFCGRCHSDAALMAPYSIPTDQVQRFDSSAHGRALLGEKNFAAPSCIGCHGSHSALPPSVTEVSLVCGRCHVSEAESFDTGPHGEAAVSGRLEGCLGCHQNHDTERVPPDRVAATCTKCHAEGTSAHALGVEMQQYLVQAEADLHAADEALAELALNGRQTGDARFRYQTALTAFRQAGRAQHALDLQQLEELTRRVRSISRDINAMLETYEERRWEHKLFLLVVWFLALSAIYLSWTALRRLETTGSDT
jgi:hypothetical protein